MAFVTSASTDEEVNAALDDNADYDVSASVVKAKNYIVAARIYLRRKAEEMTKGGVSVRDDYQKTTEALAKAERWWAANDSSAVTASGGGRVRQFSFEEFR